MNLQLAGRVLGHSQPTTTYRFVSAGTDTLADAAAILQAVQLDGSGSLHRSFLISPTDRSDQLAAKTNDST